MNEAYQMEDVLAQEELTTAVRAAYGMGKNDDILTHLLALNHACA